MINNSIQKIYQDHHLNNRPENFSLLEKERSELLKENIGKGKKVLDIGCRDGNLTKHFVEGNSVTGVDIDQNALNKASNKLGIKTVLMDLNADWAELGDEKFDVIVAGEILEHLYYPDKVIEKASRHLKSDGIFIGSIPNAFSLKNRLRYLKASKRFTPLSDPTHINHFSFSEFKSLLEKHFGCVQIIGLGRFEKLSKLFPSLIAFDFFFVSRL